MAYSLYSLLKTKFCEDRENVLVFTTDKTLNERFTPKHRPCMFVINNGYTAPYKNNNVEGRVVFENRRSTRIDKRFSSYDEKNTGLNEKQPVEDEGKNKVSKLELSELAHKRRVVLMPTKLKNNFLKQTSRVIEEEIDLPSHSKYFDASTPKSTKNGRVNEDSVVKHFELGDKTIKRSWNGEFKTPENTHNNSNYYYALPPIYSQRNSPYVGQPSSLYKWKRRPITKEELDEEIDTYMSELKFKIPNTGATDDVDSFVQEYMLETEKYLNESGNANVVEE